MTLRSLPKAKAFDRPQGYSWDAPAGALSEWADRPLAAEADDRNTVSIYDVIGQDYWTGEGFTAKKMAGILRGIGASPVTVNVNSPGGDMFEGLAIYNLLAEHPARVTVKVMGIAASAASVIAMAADDLLMGTGSMLMIHRAWGVVVGNRNDFADAADKFDTFDRSMAAIYSARTGIAENDILALLDGPSRTSDGTYMTASEAIDQKFADGTFDAGDAGPDARAAVPAPILARRRMEAAMARDGIGRKERADYFSTILGARDAAQPAPRDAGDLTAADILSAIRTLR
ncbi:head maturation protease, ClpP-related [Xanthobacter sp. V0B-10]|uniref:head maturation protease, ClpP-related n=1 Tax=Xanthobacter albus TaxID=3119929 RepID=UPI003726E806